MQKDVVVRWGDEGSNLKIDGLFEMKLVLYMNECPDNKPFNSC